MRRGFTFCTLGCAIGLTAITAVRAMPAQAQTAVSSNWCEDLVVLKTALPSPDL